jgi:hypothetical protein
VLFTRSAVEGWAQRSGSAPTLIYHRSSKERIGDKGIALPCTRRRDASKLGYCGVLTARCVLDTQRAVARRSDFSVSKQCVVLGPGRDLFVGG